MATTERRIAATTQKLISAQNKTVADLSQETGIPYNTLKRRVTTGRDIKVEEIDAIAEALDVDALDLLRGSAQQQEHQSKQRAAA